MLVKHYFKNPLLTGSIKSASKSLALAMLSELPEDASNILEFGVGTGPITDEILNKYNARKTKVCLFEYSASLSEKLMHKYPYAQVYPGLVHTHTSVFEELDGSCVVISSLPFKSMPAKIALETIKVIEYLVLEKKAIYRQYTYMIPGKKEEPFKLSSSCRLKWIKRDLVLKNMPPAYVYELVEK